MDSEFTADVKEFIGKHIHSLAQLEVLLLLRREPERAWSTNEITTALYLRSQMATELLTDLARRGFGVYSGDGFRYQPANDEDRQSIDRLAQLYCDRRVAVTIEIFSKPIDSVRAFADAFRLRKDN